MSKILLACGGTGGHLAPGIALAESLQSQNHETLLIVSSKIVDQQMTAKYRGLHFVAGRGRGFGPGLINKILFFPSLFGAIYSSLRLVRQFRPSVLICFGGFMSLGPALACKICGIPVLVHEANRRPGKAVRLIARFAESIHLPHGVRIKNISAERQHDSGFPVRKEIAPLARDHARQHLNFPTTGRMILVTGGSQGAQVLTRWVENNHEAFNQRGIHVLCLTGAGGRQGEVNNPSSIIRYLPFCNDMASAYSASDVALTRSGAGTLAELATCRTPAVLIPYPLAADDHQTANALYAVNAGIAQMISEKNIENLNNIIFGLLNEPSKLQAMKDALVRADANNHWEEILKEVLVLAKEEGGKK
jgi:UDP-N-acetylglucosamine--N-acetylmuramyl-(pentapeptide) pyrophosphoryl-undecaprenol N-acetylglucosamine transferase